MSFVNLSGSDQYGQGGYPAWGASSSDRGRWERGTPDYTGADSFDNILKKIDSTLASTPGKTFCHRISSAVSNFHKYFPSFFQSKQGHLGENTLVIQLINFIIITAHL